MLTPRENHTATLLSDGRVLIVGGETGCFRGLCRAALVAAMSNRGPHEPAG